MRTYPLHTGKRLSRKKRKVKWQRLLNWRKSRVYFANKLFAELDESQSTPPIIWGDGGRLIDISEDHDDVTMPLPEVWLTPADVNTPDSESRTQIRQNARSADGTATTTSGRAGGHRQS